MSKAPIVSESLRLYYMVIGLLVIAWTYVAIEITRYAVVQLFNDIAYWFAPAMIVFATLILPISLAAWRAKKSIIFREPEWHFEEREISYSEYLNMMKDYRQAYSMLFARLEKRWFGVFIILFAAALMLPFILFALSPLLFWLTPFLFGGLVLISGIVASIFIFNLTSNDASRYFSFQPPSLLEQAFRIMGNTPGISWAGVQLRIGESEGYFIIQKPRVIARIEGIEGAAKIVAVPDETGMLKDVKSILKIEKGKEEEIQLSFDPQRRDSSKALLWLVRETLKKYVEVRGRDEIIEEILEDVGFEEVDNTRQ